MTGGGGEALLSSGQGADDEESLGPLEPMVSKSGGAVQRLFQTRSRKTKGGTKLGLHSEQRKRKKAAST